MPVVGVVASAGLLGEKLTHAHLIGGALILAGLAIVLSVKQGGKPDALTAMRPVSTDT